MDPDTVAQISAHADHITRALLALLSIGGPLLAFAATVRAIRKDRNG